MNIQNAEHKNEHKNQDLEPRSLVPKGITIGLAMFALGLSVAG